MPGTDPVNVGSWVVMLPFDQDCESSLNAGPPPETEEPDRAVDADVRQAVALPKV